MTARLVALALALLVVAAGARAQGDPAPADLEDLPVRPLTLTVSGGVSLGAYESGVNWALLYLLKMANEGASWTGEARPDSLDRYELVVATGASAGNINALMSSTEWARRDFTRRPPEQTLFWEAWVNVGMGQILPEFGDEGPLVARADSEGTAALTRRYFDGPLRARLIDTLMPEAGDAFDPGVDVAVGLAITRVNPSTEVLERSAGEPVGLRIRTQRAVAVYRLHSVPRAGERPGHLFISHHDATRTPFADAVRERHWLEEAPATPAAAGAACLDPGRLGQLVLPAFHADRTRQDARANVNQAYRMTLASSAFPLAFEAVPITYVGERSPGGLAVGEYRTEPFLDGGVFDNNPLGLALGLYEHVSSQNAGCYENADTSYRAGIAWRRPLFVYIDPDDRRPESAEVELAPANPGLATLGRFMSG
ncbi:MAG TPA: patatin-like phospholipase family protein, partial [Rhodothermales bacterium]|nr:patatin-like phospholipase family protein [Rhodothermales bacterium]